MISIYNDLLEKKMCGIAGAIEYKGENFINFGQKSSVYDHIRRRGPDYYGVKIHHTDNYQITQAHSRLSIIDLTELSHQPFVSEDENFVLGI